MLYMTTGDSVECPMCGAEIFPEDELSDLGEVLHCPLCDEEVECETPEPDLEW